MQKKVRGKVQLQPVWPSLNTPQKYQTQSSHDSTVHTSCQADQWSQGTCWFLHIKEHQGHRLAKSTEKLCLLRVWDWQCLLSGGTLSLCGQPDRLRWCGYKPVTWPVPSQPGVGQRLSFLSAREASGDREAYAGDYIGSSWKCWFWVTKTRVESWVSPVFKSKWPKKSQGEAGLQGQRHSSLHLRLDLKHSSYSYSIGEPWTIPRTVGETPIMHWKSELKSDSSVIPGLQCYFTATVAQGKKLNKHQRVICGSLFFQASRLRLQTRRLPLIDGGFSCG